MYLHTLSLNPSFLKVFNLIDLTEVGVRHFEVVVRHLFFLQVSQEKAEISFYIYFFLYNETLNKF